MSSLRALSRSVIGRSVLLNVAAYFAVLLVVRTVRHVLDPSLSKLDALLVLSAGAAYGLGVGIVTGGLAYLILQRGPKMLKLARRVQALVAGLSMFVFVPIWTGSSSRFALTVALMLALASAALTWVLSRRVLETADAPQTERHNHL